MRLEKASRQRGKHMDEKDILWGLTDSNTMEEVREKAFALIGKIRFMPAATVNEGRPENRILDFNRLSDGNLYFMTSRGKPTYEQLCKRPQLVMNTLVDERYSLRLSAWVSETTDQAVWDEFFKLNPGTKEMYRKNFDIVALYRIDRGEGEIFHLYANERIRRLRFAFGGEEIRPMTYRITEECVGCGICQENCVERAIHQKDDGKYYIKEMDCDDCGICYMKCPQADTALICRLKEQGET